MSTTSVGAGADSADDAGGVAGPPTGVRAVEGTDEPTGADTGGRPAAPSPRAVWAGRAVVLAGVALAVGTLLASGLGVLGADLDTKWQVLDLRVLGDDPLRSLWYLHTQPPGYNLILGALAWSPLPLAGGWYALNVAALAGVGLLVHAMLVRWGVGPVAAGVVVAVALLDPSLLGALRFGHYEILVAFGIVAALASAQRYLDEPRPRWLLLSSATVTLCVLVRSLFHPAWAVAAIALLVAIRPAPRRYVAAAIALPLVLSGGWMLKNQLVFGELTTSSWLGFNLQRGVVAPMARDAVRADVASGRVSSLALEYPWGSIGQYDPWVGDCTTHDHPAVSLPEKQPYLGIRIANFNHECFLPVYRQARADAVRLIREHPGRYLSTRADGLMMSYQVGDTGPAGDTWIDRAYRPALLVTGVRLSQDDWNLPLVGWDHVRLDVSLTLALLSGFVAGRGTVAAVRLARTGWRTRRRWPTGEVMWVVVAATVAVVLVGGVLVEFGENGRFRSSLDPLLIALPLGWCTLAVRRWRAARTDP